MGCQAQRPSWWKFRTNLMNRGFAQAEAAGRVVWREQFPNQPGCPVLWSDNSHRNFNDSRIIMGAANGFIGGFVPLQAQRPWNYATGASVITCPAAEPDSIYVSNTLGEIFSLPPNFNQNYRW
jgi:hypothetical protein